MNNSARYWKNVALIREIQAQDHATYTVNELEIMYRDSVRDLDAEVRKIFNTFSVGAGITEAEARALINNAKNDEIAARLKELLAKTNDPAIRAELTKKIHAQAYGARMSRLEAVKQNVYAYFAGKALTEIQKTRTLYNTVIEESYYSTIHDIAKGCNVGINFSLIPQKTLDEMLSEKWHGAQFSERVWNNTAEAATRAQEIISRGLLAHTSRSKMADELAAVTNNTKYNAMRLVRTQTNHYTNLSELKAYKELGIEQYKYLATLDERTCETCSPLDGKIFYIKDAVEGVNYPSMHPHCRCTTTFPRNYAARWARDPHSGKGYKIPDMTYSEWIDSLSDEQKAAFEKNVKMYKNRSSDKKQYERYTNVLGKENVPKSFDLFQDLKYNDIAKYEDLKYYYRNINGRPIEYVKIDRDLEKAGITGKGRAYPVEKLNIVGWRIHAENRLKQSGLNKAEAIGFMDSAIAMMKQYPKPNTLFNYYSDNGVIGIKEIDSVVQTVVGQDRFREDTYKILEVMKKWLK